MINHLLYFLSIFIIGELFVNLTIFKYLRSKFKKNKSQGSKVNKETFLRISKSVFKGVLERFVIFLALVLGIPQILIAFGAIKIGTKFDKSEKIQNDYFLVGNIITIIIAIVYQYIYLKWRNEINVIELICN